MERNDSQDLIIGAEAIAEFLYGDRHERRRVYRIAEKRELPIFKLCGVLHARKSRLTRALEEREDAVALAGPRTPAGTHSNAEAS